MVTQSTHTISNLQDFILPKTVNSIVVLISILYIWNVWKIHQRLPLNVPHINCRKTMCASLRDAVAMPSNSSQIGCI